MSSVRAPSHVFEGRRSTGESRLRDALLLFPRLTFRAEEPKHEGELRQPPDDLTVVTMLEALELAGTERVLEIGSPSAYTAAMLSHLSGEVYSVVPEREAAERRGLTLNALGCSNAHVVLANAQAGWPVAAPYHAILVGGATSQVPLELVNQLEVGGRLVIAIGDHRGQLLERFYKRTGSLSSETLGACHVALLAGAPQSPSLLPWASHST